MKIMRPSLTTVILFFNKPAMTLRCWKSARANFSARDIILVDNGSTIESRAEIESSTEGSRFVSLAPNAGFARGMNAGLAAAFADPTCSDVLALCNDVELAENFHARLAEQKLDSQALHCPRVNFLSDRSKPAYTHGRLDVATAKLSHSYDVEKREIRFPEYYPAAALLWTRSAYEKLGGFDERYFCYWEDVELSHRAWRTGVALKAAPFLQVFHLGRGTTGGKRQYTAHFEAGRQLTMEILRQNG